MDTMKDTTMQHVTDVIIAEFKRAAEHPLKAPVIVRAAVMLGILERIEQLESDLATAEQDSRQKQARIKRLENIKSVLSEILDRFESVEKERDTLRADLEKERKEHSYTLHAAEAEAKQVDRLRAKVKEMEKQGPVAWLHETRRDSDAVTDVVKSLWSKVRGNNASAYSIPLYLAPGAKGE